jgi:hypothetical protein
MIPPKLPRTQGLFHFKRIDELSKIRLQISQKIWFELIFEIICNHKKIVASYWQVRKQLNTLNLILCKSKF